MTINYARCPKKPEGMSQLRYEDLCRLFAECGYSPKTFKTKAEHLNSSAGVIHVCPNCGKADINLLSHYRECAPDEEQHRREIQEWIWK